MFTTLSLSLFLRVKKKNSRVEFFLLEAILLLDPPPIRPTIPSAADEPEEVKASGGSSSNSSSIINYRLVPPSARAQEPAEMEWAQEAVDAPTASPWALTAEEEKRRPWSLSRSLSLLTC